ncbi:hypothetical protein [Endozoicomonas euniceicola]|uniref:Lipoprotein n=1 Tax=Endozoicomonas euniceicola TaxID=1234143 RepID=A0ABY6GR92_9GAMM|nr:hypothetical protein [Endozoicomonas euniceicola]UYM15210.1 hypothetical protein NX720_20460 [Endozoicomonas euniceicola]
MSRVYRSFIRLTPVMLSLVLTGCSWLNWFSEDKSDSHRKDARAEASKGWDYSREWQFSGLPDSIAHVFASPVQLRGQCHFSPQMLQTLNDRSQKGVLLPVLKVAQQHTLAPDFEASVPLYKSLGNHLKLAPAGTSLEFFQTLLASVEHACPENATRKIDSCVLKDWISMGGLFGSDSLYDWDRLDQWVKSHDSVGYLLMSTSELYNAPAMLHTRYSPYGRVLTNANEPERLKAVKPYIGVLQLDWVATDFVSKKQFRSRGFCRLDWGESGKSLSIPQKQAIQEALMPEFRQFMEKALQNLPIRR